LIQKENSKVSMTSQPTTNKVPWSKGISGNPSGRPAGSRNKATRAMEALVEGEAEQLTRKALEMVLNGDPVALRLCFERLLPARKDRPIELNLPSMQNATRSPRQRGKNWLALESVNPVRRRVCRLVSGDLEPDEKLNPKGD
jgi:hypothetical protein